VHGHVDISLVMSSFATGEYANVLPRKSRVHIHLVNFATYSFIFGAEFHSEDCFSAMWDIPPPVISHVYTISKSFFTRKQNMILVQFWVMYQSAVILVTHIHLDFHLSWNMDVHLQLVPAHQRVPVHFCWHMCTMF